MLISTMEMIKLGHTEESHREDPLARRAGVSVVFFIFLHEGSVFLGRSVLFFLFSHHIDFSIHMTKKDYIAFHIDSVQVINKDQPTSLVPYS